MKRRLLIALLALAGVATALFLRHEQACRRASYQGKPTPEWAIELYTSYEPSDTNAAAVAFRAMGSNAVPALRALVNRRDPFYEKLFSITPGASPPSRAVTCSRNSNRDARSNIGSGPFAPSG